MTTIVAHLERYLGQIERGWKPRDDPSGIRCARFRDQPCEGVCTYTTLGLSDAILPISDAQNVRQELLMSLSPNYPGERVASFLETFAAFIQSENRALLRGNVVGPTMKVVDGTKAASVYATLPMLFDEGDTHVSGINASDCDCVVIATR